METGYGSIFEMPLHHNPFADNTFSETNNGSHRNGNSLDESLFDT